MARPGVMLYFELRQALKLLNYEQKGRLLDAIMEYGEFGVLPEFEGMLGMAWAFLQPKLDRDKESYQATVEKRSKAARTRWERQQGRSEDANASGALQTMPTTTGTPITTASITTSTTGTATGTTTGNPTATGKETDADFESRRRDQIAKLARLGSV